LEATQFHRRANANRQRATKSLHSYFPILVLASGLSGVRDNTGGDMLDRD
jgi:hypothetical protein